MTPIDAIEALKAGGPYAVAVGCAWWAWQERSSRLAAFDRLLALTERAVESQTQLRAAVEALTTAVQRGEG